MLRLGITTDTEDITGTVITEQDAFVTKEMVEALKPIHPDLRALAHETDEISHQLPEGDFQANVCLNYGGRDEIIRAARAFAQKCVDGEMDPADDADWNEYLKKMEKVICFQAFIVLAVRVFLSVKST